jgi:hypothetical protein
MDPIYEAYQGTILEKIAHLDSFIQSVSAKSPKVGDELYDLLVLAIMAKNKPNIIGGVVGKPGQGAGGPEQFWLNKYNGVKNVDFSLFSDSGEMWIDINNEDNLSKSMKVRFTGNPETDATSAFRALSKEI